MATRVPIARGRRVVKMSIIKRSVNVKMHKASRILIGEAKQTRAINIERGLNQQGYYRVMPLSSFSEVWKLIDYSDEPFDLVLINSSLFEGDAYDFYELCRDHPCIRHAVIYDVMNAFSVLPQMLLVGVESVMSMLPDVEVIDRMMDWNC